MPQHVIETIRNNEEKGIYRVEGRTDLKLLLDDLESLLNVKP
jgi:hypothetical protein